jgi:hypothetical protein
MCRFRFMITALHKAQACINTCLHASLTEECEDMSTDQMPCGNQVGETTPSRTRTLTRRHGHTRKHNAAHAHTHATPTHTRSTATIRTRIPHKYQHLRSHLHLHTCTHKNMYTNTNTHKHRSTHTKTHMYTQLALRQFSGSSLQLFSVGLLDCAVHRNRSHVIHPIGGVSAKPVDRDSAKEWCVLKFAERSFYSETFNQVHTSLSRSFSSLH